MYVDVHVGSPKHEPLNQGLVPNLLHNMQVD